MPVEPQARPGAAQPSADPPCAANLPADERIRRILIIKWSAMGDVALASAGFEDVYRAFPGRQIDLNTLPPWDRLFAHDRRFRKILAPNLRGEDGQFRAIWYWLREVSAAQYDLIIDLQSTDRSRFLLALLSLCGRRARYRVGNQRVIPYNVAPPRQPEPRHAFALLRTTLACAGIPSITERPILQFGGEQERRAAALLAEHGLKPDTYGVFLPGSQAAGYLKRWGADRYVALGERLQEGGVQKVLVVGGPDERAECQRISEAGPAWAINLCGRTEILDVIPLCATARFIVANDTGTAHLAAATARPMVVLCGPTDPRRVRPPGENVVALQADIPCINCYRKHCTHHSCMALIGPEAVRTALAQLGVSFPQSPDSSDGGVLGAGISSDISGNGGAFAGIRRFP